VGEKEAAQGMAQVKDMASGEQIEMEISLTLQYLLKQLRNAGFSAQDNPAPESGTT
jgi:histidyl-tRNA synthetase